MQILFLDSNTATHLAWVPLGPHHLAEQTCWLPEMRENVLVVPPLAGLVLVLLQVALDAPCLDADPAHPAPCVHLHPTAHVQYQPHFFGCLQLQVSWSNV